MKQCKECGEVTVSDTTFCLSCGGRMVDMSLAEKDAYEREQETRKQSINRKIQRKQYIERIVIGVFAVLALLGSALLIINNGFHMILIVVFIFAVVGAFQILSPELAWKAQHAFSFIMYDTITPSEFGIKMVKAGGYVMMTIAAVCALVMATL